MKVIVSMNKVLGRDGGEWDEMVRHELAWALWTMDIVDLMDTVDGNQRFSTG